VADPRTGAAARAGAAPQANITAIAQAKMTFGNFTIEYLLFYFAM
jgi:hypothetical protein